MKRVTWWGKWICAGALALALAASAFASDPSIKSAKDRLIYGVYGEAAALDPGMTKDVVSHMMMYQIYDTLVKNDPNDFLKIVPGLAEKWEFSPDGKEVTFYLRKGVKFHNGDVMTADDVQFSLDRSLKSSFSSGIRGPIVAFEKVDDNAVKCVMQYAYLPVLEVLTNLTFGIVSKRAVEEAKANGIDFGRNPCGTGAYKMVSWQSGNELVLERFDEYYDGPAYIKNLVYKLIPDTGSGALALESGAIDCYYNVANSDYQYMMEQPNVAYVQCPGIGIWHVVFNVTDGIFKDKRLRQAVAYAINLEDVVVGGMDGYAEVATCLSPSTAFGYDKDAKWYQQNIKKAKELMAEAGYPDGFEVSFRMMGTPTYVKPAEVIQDQLRQIGIKVKFEKMERAAFLEDVTANRQFVAAVHMINATIRDADLILNRRVHGGKMIGGGNNYAGYSNPEVDALIDAARQSTDENERKNLYKKVFEILKEDVPYIPLYTNQSYFFFNKKLKNFHKNPLYRFYIHNMYFES